MDDVDAFDTNGCQFEGKNVTLSSYAMKAWGAVINAFPALIK
jgi:hypothetical protein